MDKVKMDIGEFKDYLEKFEKDIVVRGIKAALLGRYMMIPIRRGKLEKTEFGKILGPEFIYLEPAAIDYYGLIKKSSGLVAKFANSTELQVRAVRAPIVHFASLKIENISDLAPELVRNFPEFKKMLVVLRQFKRNSKEKGVQDASDGGNK